MEADYDQIHEHIKDADDAAYFATMLEATVKANLAKEQADWKPAAK